MKRKLLSVLLAMVMLLSMMPLGAVVSAATTGTYDGMTYEINNGKVTITGYTSVLPSDLVIPDSIAGYPVTGIANSAFNTSDLTSVVIPDTVTAIGDGAFAWCGSLTTANIPDGVTSIASGTFGKCWSLTSITIPDSVTFIGNDAFYDCSSLTSIDIPDGVTTIEDNTFSECSRLTSITIPNGVTSIGASAFYNCSRLAFVTIPDSVTSIRESAFEGCDTLTTVHYYGSLSDKEKIAIDGGNAALSSADWHYFDNPCDPDCNECGETITPSHDYDSPCDRDCDACGAVRTAPHAYNNACDTTCNLCGAIRRVGDHVYSNACDDTCNVCDAYRTPADHVYDNSCDVNCNVCGAERNIDHTYTNACDVLCDVCGAERLPSDHVYDNACDTMCNVCGDVREVPDHVYGFVCDTTCNVCGAVRETEAHVYTDVCDRDCNVCKEKRTPPHDYDNDCDDECHSCGEIRIPSDHTYTNAADDTCNSCGYVRELDYTGNNFVFEPTESGRYRFEFNDADYPMYFVSVSVYDVEGNEIPYEDVSYIVGENFRQHYKAIIVTLTAGERYAIHTNATWLRRSVEKLCDHEYESFISSPPGCFYSGLRTYICIKCDDTYNIEIPASHNYYIAYVTPQCVGGEAEYFCGDCGSYYYAPYPDAPEHNNFFDSQVEPDCENEGYTVFICGSCGQETKTDYTAALGHTYDDAHDAFCNTCGAVRSASGPTGDCIWTLDGTHLTISGNGAMADYDYSNPAPWGTVITSVTIEDGVTSIGACAFVGCQNLTSVTIPDSVTTIGCEAFYACIDLTSVTIGNGVTTISERAFSDCYRLTTVTIPSSVTFMGYSAFAWCGLTSVIVENGVTTIDSGAFFYCTNLTSVTIPDSVTSIGRSAFYECDDLTDVYYAGNKRQANAIAMGSGNDALLNATWHYGKDDPPVGLTYTINDGEVTITGYTDELPADLVIPDTIEGYPVTRLDATAFVNCERLVSIVVPDSVVDLGLELTFYNCKNLTTVTLGNSVTEIGYCMFDSCTNLRSINIPESVTRIGFSAFSSCKNLQSIVLPEGLSTIGICAFSGCTSLQSVTIPRTVTEIETAAFSACTSLSNVYYTGTREEWLKVKIDFNGNEPLYDATWPFDNGIPKGLLYEIENDEVIITGYTEDLPADLVIPEAFGGYPVTRIYGSAFVNCTTLTSVVIPDSVTSIGYYAFMHCTALSYVKLPSTITCLDWGTFGDCRSLTSIELPDGLEVLNDGAFWGSGLTSIVIPDSVHTISIEVFWGCKDLTCVELPDGLTFVGRWAFQDCPSLETVIIPKSVTTIGAYAFDGCVSLQDVYYAGTKEESEKIYIEQDGNTPVIKTTWHYSDGSIAEGLPYSGLLYEKENGEVTITGYTEDLPADLVIPDTIGGYPVTAIGDSAFLNCTTLTLVTLPDTIKTIGNGAFCECWALTMINIPDSVTTIGDNAFSWCWALTSINIPDGVTTIGKWAFGMSSLTSITIPDSVTTIGDYAFLCNNLTSVTIPDSVTTIGDFAFEDCSKLTSVTIPDSVTTIGEAAFSNCTSLTDVYYGGTKEDKANITIYSYNDDLLNATWHYEPEVPAGLLYKINDGEVTITGYTDELPADLIIPATIEGCPVTTIDYSAFADCTTLTSITIPDNVVFIDDEVFCGCTNLIAIEVDSENPQYTSEDGVLFNKDKTVLLCYPGGKAGPYTIPNGVTTIGKGAFYGCDGLTSIAIPDSVTTIGFEAFYWCTNLTSITIPNSVTAIDSYAFYHCEWLDTVILPNSITSIGNYAFYYCPMLGAVHYDGSKAQANAITIDSGNDSLLNATWRYAADPISNEVTHSVMETEKGNGLAFRFELSAKGVVKNNKNVVDLSKATVHYLGKDCKLIGMGAIVTNSDDAADDLTLDAVNDFNVIDIPVVYLQEANANSCAFATRITNIPVDQPERVIYARPYFIVEVDGEQITVYGDVDSACCADYL